MSRQLRVKAPPASSSLQQGLEPHHRDVPAVAPTVECQQWLPGSDLVVRHRDVADFAFQMSGPLRRDRRRLGPDALSLRRS
jgi:hypothetical protein